MTVRALAVQPAVKSAAPALALQRSCACAETAESCPRCTGKKPALQRLAHGAAPRGLPGGVGDVLRGAGQPLPLAIRARMEDGFGHDFADVRIHADAAALRSAAAVSARAYTVGRHVVLGRSAPDLASSAGHRLLGHELTHVIQQSRGGVGEGIDPDPALEREAESAGAAIASGRAASVRSNAAIGIQRDADDEKSQHPTMERVTTELAKLLGFNESTSRIVSASIEGGMTGFAHQWNEGETGKHLGQHVKEFSVWDIPDLIKGYLVGAVEGIASPITDLFAIGVMVEQLNNFVGNLASSALSRAAELAQDLRGIIGALAGAFDPIRQFFKGLVGKGREGLKQLIEMINGGSGSLIERAIKLARSVGRSQGEGVAKSLESAWGPRQPEEEASGALGEFSNWVGRGRDALIKSPWSKVGNKAGYAVGFALIQVLMLVFSDGVGNLILRGGKALSGLAEVGTMLGKTIESAAKFVTTAGSIIAKVEEAVAAAMTFLMKPLMPILEPLMKPIAGVMERLGGFLRKLLGIAEKDAARVAATAATKAVADIHPSAHLPPPEHPTGSPHLSKPTATPHPQPHVTTPDATPHPTAHPSAKAADPHLGATPDPHVTAPAADPHALHPEQKAAPHPGSDAAHKPLADPVPVGNGHHTQMTPAGFELCSPAPCPNLRVVYKDQLAANPRLKGELDDLDALRKFSAQREAAGLPDPALAKNASEKAARLQQKLEAAAQGQPIPTFPHLKAPVGPPQAHPVPPLQTGPYSSGQGAVAGHHAHQSASMSPAGTVSKQGNPNHGKALAIQQNVPGFSEAQHGAASATQRNVNRAMRGETHNPLVGNVRINATGNGTNITASLDFEDAKAFYALRAAGRSPEEALELVMRSRAQIEASGTAVVRVPTR